jgi:hypothetical protein
MKRIILFLLCSTVLAGAQPKSLFYMTENPRLRKILLRPCG